MELWIRSQEKTRLVKCNNILTHQFSDETCGIQVNDDCFVGEYKTKERALEVLDEIQELVKAFYTVPEKTVVGMNIFYEMPKE